MAISEAEAIAFRGEIRAIDSDIQTFFRLYYITGIAAISGWLISSNTQSLQSIVVGNRGINVVALLVFAFLNCVALTFLLYRSIEIHELAQFLVCSSSGTAAAVQWERWRKSKRGVTRIAKRVHTPLLTIVPILVSCALLTISASALMSLTHEHGSRASLNTPLSRVIDSLADASHSRRIVTPPSNQPGHLARSGTTLPGTWLLFGFVILAHFLPGLLIYEHLTRVNRRWKIIWRVDESARRRGAK